MVRKARKSKGTWTNQNHDILGKAQIYRVLASGDVWQFRMWIPDEKKYVRKTLRTKDLETAISRAEKKVFNIHSDVSSGRKLFGINLQSLVDAFLEWRQKDVDVGDITKGRLVTIASQTKHILNYKSPDLKISELDRQSFYEYAVYRKENYPDVQDVTIRNEQATINQMISFGYRTGLIHFDKFEFRKIKISKDKIGKRDIFTMEEYDKLVRFLRSYSSKKACPKEHEQIERLMVRDAVLIGSNALLRVGELWQLKWSDIEQYEEIYDDEEKKLILVYINVRAETSKVKSSRRVISRGGEYFQRLHKRTKPKKTDFIFANVGGTTPLHKNKWYIHWKNLMEGIGIEDYQERKLTWYSLRHFGITMRLKAGNLMSEVAQIAGTSTSHIETHYQHYDDTMARSVAVKNFSIDKRGIILRDD